MEELKPCPFCGGLADWFAGIGWFSVECTGCHIETEAYTEAEVAADAWNRRAATPPIAAQADRRDAERYRWLRGMVTSGREDEAIAALEAADPDPDTNEKFDAAIDAAMSSPLRIEGDGVPADGGSA